MPEVAHPSVAPYWRRVLAMGIDYAVGIGLLAMLWPWLPEGPPPTAYSMSLYTEQQFINYFTMVGVVCILPFINGLLIIVTSWHGTIGHLLSNIRLEPIGHSTSLLRGVVGRTLRTFFGLLFLCIPGPALALMIAFSASVLFSLPFTTGDQMLRSIGTPDWLRLGLHSLSFILLFIAAWYIIIRPIGTVLRDRLFRSDGRLTQRDYATNTTYKLRR